MRPLLSIAILLILSNPAIAGGRRRTAATSPASAGELTITFVGVSGTGNDALLDAGMASRPRGVIKRTFGIRLGNTNMNGTAVLRVWLESFDGRSAIRIDGAPIGTQPVVVDAHAPLGHVTTHRLEIRIPDDVDPGTFASSIHWEATTE